MKRKQTLSLSLAKHRCRLIQRLHHSQKATAPPHTPLLMAVVSKQVHPLVCHNVSIGPNTSQNMPPSMQLQQPRKPRSQPCPRHSQLRAEQIIHIPTSESQQLRPPSCSQKCQKLSLLWRLLQLSIMPRAPICHRNTVETKRTLMEERILAIEVAQSHENCINDEEDSQRHIFALRQCILSKHRVCQYTDTVNHRKLIQ